MDKYLIHPTGQNPADVTQTPARKRSGDELDQHNSCKKNRLDDTLLNSNYYSPLNLNDNGDVLSSHKQLRLRKAKIPPITLYQKLSNPKDTYKKIQSWAENPVYFKQSGEVRYIYATDKTDFISIKEQLKLIILSGPVIVQKKTYTRN